MVGADSYQARQGGNSMKFRIAKEAFLDGLQQVQHVVSSTLQRAVGIVGAIIIEAIHIYVCFTTAALIEKSDGRQQLARCIKLRFQDYTLFCVWW